MNTNELAAHLLHDTEYLYRPLQVKIVNPAKPDQALDIESVRVVQDGFGSVVLIETKSDGRYWSETLGRYVTIPED